MDKLEDNAELKDIIEKVNELIEIRNKEMEEEIERLKAQSLFLKLQLNKDNIWREIMGSTTKRSMI